MTETTPGIQPSERNVRMSKSETTIRMTRCGIDRTLHGYIFTDHAHEREWARQEEEASYWRQQEEEQARQMEEEYAAVMEAQQVEQYFWMEQDQLREMLS